MTTEKIVTLTKEHLDILKKHAKNKAPNESCAILFGKNEDGAISIKEIFLSENIEESTVSFTISNDELIKAYQEAEKKSLEVSAIFHSHPNSQAYPSQTDLKYMEINPVPWLIFSNISDEIKGYILETNIIQVVVSIL